MEGRILGGTWVLDHALGAGGMGAVYRAHNVHAPRIRAAIKLLHPGLFDGQARQRFIREAELVANLDHPHVVKVRNIRLDDELPFLEMELVEAANLLEHMGDAPLAIDQALVFFEQLVSAIRYLHRQGIAHRDVKPANLLIRKGTMLTLVDFGLAVEGEEGLLAEAAEPPPIGTVAYAPPEWITPDQLDPYLWDLYACGVVLYQMLCGTLPFDASGASDARHAALAVMAQKAATPHLDPGPAFPEPLRALVRDLTARDPRQRLQPARELAKRVHDVQGALSVDPDMILAKGLHGDELRRAVTLRGLEATREDTEHAEPEVFEGSLLSHSLAPAPLPTTPPKPWMVVAALLVLLLLGVAMAVAFSAL